MDAKSASESAAVTNRTTVEQTSEREVVVTRTFNAPARIVFEAWTKPELFKRWWLPRSIGMTLLSWESDVRVGGGYRLEIGHPSSEKPMAFFGKYLEVKPHSRLVWTNEESDGGPVTTLTLEEKAGKTLVVVHELYPSKQAFDANVGSADGLPESFAQLDEVLVTLA